MRFFSHKIEYNCQQILPKLRTLKNVPRLKVHNHSPSVHGIVFHIEEIITDENEIKSKQRNELKMYEIN